MSLKVTLFLCWFCFVLLRAFSDDTNSKQKTPHKEPCTWQISCWWDIRSLNYHSNKIAHELFTKWNPLVQQKGAQTFNTFFLLGHWWWTQHINQSTCLQKMVDDRDDLTLWVKKVSSTATIVLLQLVDLFSVLGLVYEDTLWPTKHTGPTTWRYSQF